MIPFPDKKYQIILADPPWNIQIISHKVRPKQLDMPYSRMSLEQIKQMPIQDIVSEKGCHLFLWTTHKYLPKAFEVLNSWHFKYHCTLVWDKTYGFTPFSFMWSTEFCLYAQIKKKWIRPNKIGIKTLIREKPIEHSRKPLSMMRLIESFCGDLPRIELFARERVEGWDAWGDEVDGKKIIKTKLKTREQYKLI